MLETNMSYSPSWFRSPKSMPIPLKELAPIRLDLGTIGWCAPFTSANAILPGFDLFCSRREVPKSWATYSSGNWSPSRSVAAAPSVQPMRMSRGMTSSASTKPFSVHRRMWSSPPLRALDSESFMTTPPRTEGSRTGLSGK